MQITFLRIRNFKRIREMTLADMENALILVGKNNTGKTAVLDAVRAVGGSYRIREEDFREDFSNIEIMVALSIREEDLAELHKNGLVSTYRRYDAWYRDFCKKLPSFQDGVLTFTFVANRQGRVRYEDGIHKDNPSISRIFPKIYYMDTRRDFKQFQDDLLMMQEDDLLKQMRMGCCIFDQAKKCTHCFSCIGLINQKRPEQVNALAAARLARSGRPAVVAIDGRCGSGKSGLGDLMGRLLPCNVVHMDDYYLPPDRRAENWEEIPAGNMDLARFLQEVLVPAGAGVPIRCRPYDCRSGTLGEGTTLPVRPLTVVEGSYSQHPLLTARYDLRLFLTCAPEEQRRRLERREGAHFAAYESRWMPLEERYIRQCGPEKGCQLVIDTTGFFP